MNPDGTFATGRNAQAGAARQLKAREREEARAAAALDRRLRSTNFGGLGKAAVGLAIVLSFFRLRKTVRSDDADLLRN